MKNKISTGGEPCFNFFCSKICVERRCENSGVFAILLFYPKLTSLRLSAV